MKTNSIFKNLQCLLALIIFSALGLKSYAGVSTDSIFIAPPSNLSVTFQNPYTGKLQWHDNSNNESGFVIDYKKASDSAWVNHLQAGQNQTQKDAPGLQPGTAYNFRIRAFNFAGYSGYSNIAAGTTPFDSILFFTPNAPSGLTATSFGSRFVRLQWNDNSGNETGFKIERRAGGDSIPWALIATLTSNRNNFGDSSVMPNTTYSYRVLAFNGVGSSAYSNVATVRTTSANVLNPVVPNGTTPLFTWNNIPEAVTYKVAIALDVNFDAIVFQSGNLSSTQFQVPANTLSTNMNYYYRVSGFTSNNIEAYSDVSDFQTAITGIIHFNSEMPAGYSLKQNYPNPFNPATTIKFDIIKNDIVKLEVFDARGSKIDELVNSLLTAGSYSIEWNASKQSSGVYFYRIITSDFTKTMKMSLVK